MRRDRAPAGAERGRAATGSTTVPIAGSVRRSPEIHATAATSPATTDTAFANDRSRPSGVTTLCQASQACRTRASGRSQPPPGREAIAGAASRTASAGAAGHKAYAASAVQGRDSRVE